jgi:transcriptional regulator with XRE-family HTH domain
MADDIKKIRLENLNFLYDRMVEQFPNEPEHGMLRRFGQRVGVSPAYLSHLRNDRKNVGHATARKIEAAFRLEEGWMDSSHDVVADVDAATREAMTLFSGASAGVKEAMITLLKEWSKGKV